MEKQAVCDHFELQPKRKLCANCCNTREEHALIDDDVADIQALLQLLTQSQKYPEQDSNNIYCWIPPNCHPSRYQEYFKDWPVKLVPRFSSKGQKNRLKRLIHQLPVSDLLERKCRFVEPNYYSDLKSFTEELKNKALKIGYVKEWEASMPLQCPNCLVLFDVKDLVVMSSSGVQAYHPTCFICIKDHELLVDLIHCLDNKENIFCVRHFSETQKKRCHACDELIFAQRYAQARDKYYHRDHLLCFSCDSPLRDNKGYEHEEELFCSTCYEEKFGDDCAKCGKRIEINSQHVNFKDKCWHMECFACAECNKTPSEVEEYDGKFYCIDCFKGNYAPRCNNCQEIFEGQVRVIEYEDNFYHDTCFKCSNCQDTIGTGGFIPSGDKVYCKQCHLNKFGVKCSRCKYSITDDRGILHDKHPYHASCFTCYSCCVQLANKPFKSVDGKWYCISCFGNIISRNCQACGEPIYLGENDVMYSYKGYRWHSCCFECKSCNKALSDVPFTLQGSDLMCRMCSSRETDNVPNIATKYAA